MTDFMISVKKWTTNPPHSDTLNVHFKLVRWGFKTGSLVKSLVYMYYQSGQNQDVGIRINMKMRKMF